MLAQESCSVRIYFTQSFRSVQLSSPQQPHYQPTPPCKPPVAHLIEFKTSMSSTAEASEMEYTALPFPSEDYFLEDAELLNASGNSLDLTSWETAFQDDSTLANLNADCVQLILNRLQLADSCHLGLSCRRLYFLWVEERKTTRAVEIGWWDHEWKRKRAIFKDNANRDARDSVEKMEERPAKLALFLCKGNALLCKFQKLAGTFVNLRYLEMFITIRSKHFAPLLTLLATSVRQLTTLRLHPTFADILNVTSPNYFWCALAQMQHPTLRHLTIVATELAGRYGRYDTPTDIPQLPILQQLVSFSFFLKTKTIIYQIIRQLMTDSSSPGAHLTPGVAARFGLPLYMCLLSDLAVQPELLPYFTYLEMNIEWLYRYNGEISEERATFFRCLAQMPHLQKVMLKFGYYNRKINTADFPSLLTALASLAHLQELALDCEENESFGERNAWPADSLPVLPTVRTLSLWYCTPDHTDIVEQFQLRRTFPALRQLEVYFNMDSCFADSCQYGKRDSWSAEPKVEPTLQQLQACGRQLARGLLKLNVVAEKKEPTQVKIDLEMNFRFCYKLAFNSFNSLEDLEKGKTGSWYNSMSYLW